LAKALAVARDQSLDLDQANRTGFGGSTFLSNNTILLSPPDKRAGGGPSAKLTHISRAREAGLI
jgi:hypothetical protein